MHRSQERMKRIYFICCTLPVCGYLPEQTQKKLIKTAILGLILVIEKMSQHDGWLKLNSVRASYGGEPKSILAPRNYVRVGAFC